MELNEAVLAELPDVALYHLLTLCSLEQVLRFQRVLGKQRAPVFQEVTKLFNSKYGFHDLPLSVIHKIVNEEDKDVSARTASRYGDYPEYIASIYDQMRSLNWTLQIIMDKGREESAVAMLKRKAEADDIPIAIKHRCAKCLLYLTNKYSFARKVVESLYEDNYMAEDDLLWAIDYGKLKVDADFISLLLSFPKEMSPDLLRALLERTSDADARQVYDLFQARLATTGLAAVFEERLR